MNAHRLDGTYQREPGFIRFERNDFVRIKSDRTMKYVVTGIDLGNAETYRPDTAKAQLSQCGTGFLRHVSVSELELAV